MLRQISLDNGASHGDVYDVLETVHSLRLCGYQCIPSDEVVITGHLTVLTISEVHLFAVTTFDRIGGTVCTP